MPTDLVFAPTVEEDLTENIRVVEELWGHRDGSLPQLLNLPKKPRFLDELK